MTVLAAALMLLAPLCMVLLLSHLRAPDDDFDWSVQTDSSTDKSTRLSDTTLLTGEDTEPKTAQSTSTTPMATAATPSTTATPTPTPAPTSMATATLPTAAQAQAQAQMHMQTPTIVNTPAATPAPTPSAADSSLPAQVMNPAPAFSSDTRDPQMAETAGAGEARTSSMAGDSENEPFPLPEVSPPSTFAATGHLSMAGGTAGAIGGTTKPMTPATGDLAATPGMEPGGATAPAGRNSERSARTPRKRRSGTPEPRMPGNDPAAASTTADAPWAPGFGTEVTAPEEDVILQHPLESRPVERVENLVAVTQAKGWPIALVCSDLPDDHWWVQQMVGIRGNAFAARVNFGNEDSISGSVYHMVIMFLDSPDEVRRFRIAKQFKELPEGIRRSRKFTFIRR
ncbi:MAG: hypothetical protein RIK87_30785 [Fuerstiella sp.]